MTSDTEVWGVPLRSLIALVGVILVSVVIFLLQPQSERWQCFQNESRYEVHLDPNAYVEVEGVRSYSLGFCGSYCIRNTYHRVGDLVFFEDWVLDKGANSLKKRSDEKAYFCYLKD
jgi:hypothetical protein